jgi:LacI family transcriptional regulator
MHKKKFTIRDIARMADVSHTTVSRVLNDDPRVARKTRNRVLKIVEEVGFKPDPRARSFVLGKSNLLGLEVVDISIPFCAELARGIEYQARQQGYNVIFCSTNEKPELLENFLNLMAEVGVDGLIFTSARLQEPLIEKLVDDKFPLVLINRKMRGETFNYVVLDNFQGAYTITKHLIDMGYKKVAIIDGPLNTSTGLERFKGYQQALRDHNISIRQDYIVHGPWSKMTGYTAAKRLLETKDRPEAIFGASDHLALGVIDAVEEMGLRIPDDVALSGFDDTDFASNRRINLTTISQRRYKMGQLGVQILIDQIEEKTNDCIHKIVLEPRLIIRESCGIKLRSKHDRAEEIGYQTKSISH